jgi:flavin-dependent dehydrogenase
VLLVDRATFPRSKVCGCCLSARAIALLVKSGVLQSCSELGGVPYDRLKLSARRGTAICALPAGLAMSRDVLDLTLAHQALTAGATWLTGVRASLLPTDPSSDVRTVALEEPGRRARVLVKSRVVIDATGLASGFSAHELRGERVVPHARIGAGAQVKSAALRGLTDRAVNMAVGPHGYVGVVRIGDDLWNMAAAFDVPAVRRARGVLPVVADTFRHVGWLDRSLGTSLPSWLEHMDWRGTPALSRRPHRVSARGLFVVGDAAGYVEPFTGDGMASAVAAASSVAPLARDAIGGWDVRLEAEWSRALDEVTRSRRVSSGVAWLARHPLLMDVVASVLSRWPALAAPAIARAQASIEQEAEVAA